MARPSKMKLVRIALQELVDDSLESMQQAVKNENFERAEMFKLFKERIRIVLSLCGEEKSKDGTGE